jgi:NADH-quinone oxidoreductase subunit L
MGGEQDMMKMGGLRARMPVTYRTMLIGTLAIAGIVPLAGFFSKDEILWGALGGPLGRPWIWGVGVATAGLTAFYMFRLIYLTFFGERRCDDHAWHHVHESPRVMTVPLIILAVLSVCGGWIGIPRSLSGPLLGRDINLFEHWLHPALASVPAAAGGAGGHAAAPAGHGGAHSGSAVAAAGALAGAEAHPEAPAVEYAAMGASLAVAIAGIALAHLLYLRRRDLLQRIVGAVGPLYRLVYGKYFVDELYEAAVLRPYWALCRLSRWFDTWVIDLAVNASRHVTIALSYLSTAWDTYVIDLLLVNGAGYVVRFLGWTSRRLQNGVVQSYATAIVFGLLLFVSLYFFFGLG